MIATGAIVAAMAGAERPMAAEDGVTIRLIPRAVPRLSAEVPPPVTPAPRRSVLTAPLPDLAPPVPEPAHPTREVSLTLRDLGGAPGGIALRGPSDSATLGFALRPDERVVAAQLSLAGAMSPLLQPGASSLAVALNGRTLSTVPPRREPGGFRLSLPLDPALFAAANRLDFRFAGRAGAGCDDGFNPLLWATVAEDSALTLTLERTAPVRTLARLPLPLLDPAAAEPAAGHGPVPVVLPDGADDATMRAAGVMAGWLGAASPRGVPPRFTVLRGVPAEGDGVVVLAGQPAPFPLPPLAGPTVALVPNPRDTAGTLVAVAGRSGAEAAQVAVALARGARPSGPGPLLVQAPDPPTRSPFDAPAWISTQRTVTLGEMAGPAPLEAAGPVASFAVTLRAPPDLFAGLGRSFDLFLRARLPGGDATLARIDVALEGVATPGPVFSAKLAADGTATVRLPAGALAAARALRITLDARAMAPATCAAGGGALRVGIDPASVLDLRGARHVAAWPDLAPFGRGGFPFTGMADLSETAIVLPRRPDAAEVAAFLDIMALLGRSAGIAGIKVTVARPDDAAALAGRDLLLIASGARRAEMAALLSGTKVRAAVDGLTLDGAPAELTRRLPEAAALLVAGGNPQTPGRAVVALLATTPQSLSAIPALLAGAPDAAALRGDVVLLPPAGPPSPWRLAETAPRGELPFWQRPAWWLRD